MTQYIYVIGESEGGPVKIGIGASPSKRRRELQIGNPRALHLFWTASRHDAADVECGTQRALRERRISGEWYDVSVPDAIRAIQSVIAAADCGKLPEFNRATSLREVDGSVQRRCSTCMEWLPLTSFHVSSTNGTGYQSRCKPCGLEANRERLRDPEARRRHNLSQMLRNREARASLPRTGPLRGERNPRAKLKDADRKVLIERAMRGEKPMLLAEEYGISVGYVRGLRRAARAGVVGAVA